VSASIMIRSSAKVAPCFFFIVPSPIKSPTGSSGSFQFNGNCRSCLFCFASATAATKKQRHLQDSCMPADLSFSHQRHAGAVATCSSQFLTSVHSFPKPAHFSRCLPWSQTPAAGKMSTNGPLVDGACQIVSPDPYGHLDNLCYVQICAHIVDMQTDFDV
jgi:hypothetical protein